MPCLAQSLVDSAHFRWKKAYGRLFLLGLLLAALAHLFAALLAPPYRPAPYRLPAAPTSAPARLVDEVVISTEGPPPEKKRTAVRELARQLEVADSADREATIAPTDFNPFAPLTAGGRGGRPGGLGGGKAEAFPVPETPPEPLRMEQPVYPPGARRRGFEGTVVVRVTVDETGKVVGAIVERSDAPQELRESALQAARRWLFRPARLRGKPVRAECSIPFRFAAGGS